MTLVGPVVAVGRTSDVHRYGPDAVVKVLHADVPGAWAATEYDIARRVFAVGLPVPEPLERVVVEGRPAIVFRRVDGPSLWESVRQGELSVPAAAEVLAGVQREIFDCDPPDGIPPVVDRLLGKIRRVDGIGDDERSEAERLVGCLPTSDRLLHGDIHPGNIILASSGPVVIDWFDASVGHPVVDVARTKLLLRSPNPELEGEPIPHLPGATAELLDGLRGHYLGALAPVLQRSGIDDREWSGCLAVMALGRVAEHSDPDSEPLLDIWRSRRRPVPVGGLEPS